MSRSRLSFENIVCAGIKPAVAGGEYYNGEYFPKHTRPDGSVVNARWVGNFFLNRAPYTDGEGNRHEGSNTVLTLTAWNGNNAADGKGLADFCAKYVSPGRAISCDVDVRNFNKRLFHNGQPDLDEAGQQKMLNNLISLTIISLNKQGEYPIALGNESTEQIKREIAMYSVNPAATFFARPLTWNSADPNDVGRNAWVNGIVALRSAAMYQPNMQSYGYARIGKIFVAGQQVTGVGATGANLQSQVSAASGGNMTYNDLLGLGLTHEQIAANPKTAHLAVAHLQAQASASMSAGAGDTDVPF
jgi:hypothetical protein